MEDGRPDDALRLYGGDFLDGFFAEEASGFEEWSETERAALRELAARGARQLAEQHDAQGVHTVAVAWGRRAAELAPDDERAFRRLLGLLERAGDRAGALQAYDEFSRRLRAEHGAEPAAETRAMVEAIRRASGMPAVAVATPPDEPVLSPVVQRQAPDRASAPGEPLAVGTSLAEGRYIIEDVLGVGGMATVYLAHDVRHERRVAVKVLRPEIAATVGATALLRGMSLRLSPMHIGAASCIGTSSRTIFFSRVIRRLRSFMHSSPISGSRKQLMRRGLDLAPTPRLSHCLEAWWGRRARGIQPQRKVQLLM